MAVIETEVRSRMVLETAHVHAHTQAHAHTLTGGAQDLPDW